MSPQNIKIFEENFVNSIGWVTRKIGRIGKSIQKHESQIYYNFTINETSCGNIQISPAIVIINRIVL